MTKDGGRQTPCFIDTFVEAASDLGIPPAYVQWAAIFAVAVALGRHVWGVNQKGPFYPNLFVMLVGPPGSGKTQTEDLLLPFMRDLNANLASRHVTIQALIDELSEANEERTIDEVRVLYKHLVILTSEFVETFQGYDVHFLGTLSGWWDCPEIWRERKRKMNETLILTKICLNLLTGVQPHVLAHVLPSQAWEGGFLARTVFAYVNRPVEIFLRPKPGEVTHVTGEKIKADLYIKLVTDLESISQMTGLMKETDSFVEEYYKWKRDDHMQPYPRHPRLVSYVLRREHQLEKLSLISAASRGGKVLTGRDYKRARKWLEMSEKNLDDIFVEMTHTDELLIMRDLNTFLKRIGKGKPVPLERAWQFILGKVPAQRVWLFMMAAETAGFIEIQGLKGAGQQIMPKNVAGPEVED